MRTERMIPGRPRIHAAVAELQGLILARYPRATFEVASGEDPEGTYLIATVDVDDLTTVLESIEERLVELQVDEKLPLYVVPLRPLGHVPCEIRLPQHETRPGIEIEGPTAPPRTAPSKS